MLIFVSIHLLLLSFLSYHSYEIIQLSIKNQNSLQQSNQQRITAETALNAAESRIEHNLISNCNYKPQAIDYFTSKDYSWWQSNRVCHIEHPDYHIAYVNELLMSDPCALLQINNRNQMDNKRGVHIFRISLRASNKLTHSVLFLKSYIALPSTNSYCPEPNNRVYTKGRFAWTKTV